jgi:hypothetical protein
MKKLSCFETESLYNVQFGSITMTLFLRMYTEDGFCSPTIYHDTIVK